MKCRNGVILVFFLIRLFSAQTSYGQDSIPVIERLKIDTSYAFLQYPSLATAQKLTNIFSQASENRLVVFHFGASHIQSEVVTTEAKAYLHENFGDAGPGFLFPFSAAKTYGSINYKTSHTGTWTSAKSFQPYPKIPLGVRGMTVETRDPNASFTLTFPSPLPKEEYELLLFFDNNCKHKQGLLQRSTRSQNCFRGVLVGVLRRYLVLTSHLRCKELDFDPLFSENDSCVPC